MKQVHAQRLLKLADFLEVLPRRKFDFNDWCSGNDPSECGTTACSLGWACSMPAFRRLGARLDNGLPSLAGSEFACPSDVSERLFGLSYDDHRELFVSGLSSGATPKQAAAHIREFVADQKVFEAVAASEKRVLRCT